MANRNTVAAILALILLATAARAQGRPDAPGKAARNPRYSTSHNVRRGQEGSYMNSVYSRRSHVGPRSSFRSPFGRSPYFAQSYGWPGLSSRSRYPYWPNYSYSPYSSYLYFYDLYYQEAERSKQEADDFEAALERDGRLTGPAKVGTFPSDFLPFPPRDMTVTLDGKVQNPSPSGNPLVIGSGRHTLRISAR